MDIRQGMSVLLFLATALMVFIAFLSYRKRHLPVAKTMILVMLAASFYAFGYALEILSRNLGEFKLALHIEYLGIPFGTTLWFILVLQITGAADRHRKWLKLVVFIIPTAVFGLEMTNDWHHLVYESFDLNRTGSIPLYTTVKGLGYKVHGTYNYAIMAAGFALFIPMYLRALPLERKQIIVLILGASAPMLFNLCFWLGIDIDLTPFGFAVTGVVYVWGIFRFNLLRLTPLALSRVFETMKDGVVLFDSEDQILRHNRAAESMFPELGLTKRYPAPSEDVLRFSPQLLASIRAATTGEERFMFHRSHVNRIRHYNCSLTFIYDWGKVPAGKILLLSDVTELKENEARLRENARQLSELNAFKDKLFTIVAHDIRDPIALLVSLTELLNEELAADDLEYAELFKELKGQVQGTYHLIENLLDWYRSQKGTITFRPLGWNLKQVVSQAVLAASTKASMKQIQLTTQIDDKLTVRADKEMLDLILRNLLSNAIKHTGVGGAIEMAATLEGELTIISIHDNGAGMDEKTMDMLRLEEPIMRMPAAGVEHGEMRFGLALVREFVRIHGGSLWFDSVQGVGTTFSFTLPGSNGGRDAFDLEGMGAEER